MQCKLFLVSALISKDSSPSYRTIVRSQKQIFNLIVLCKHFTMELVVICNLELGRLLNGLGSQFDSRSTDMSISFENDLGSFLVGFL